MIPRSLEGSVDPPGYSSQQDAPLGGYAVLVTIFAGLSGSFALWLSRSARPVPDTVNVGDLALVAVATHKASRLVTKDRATSVLRAPFTHYQEDATAGEVKEEPRGRGLRRVVGQLLICPYCIGLWIASAFTAGLLVAPRLIRWIAFTLTTLTISDFLQIAYKKAENTL